MIHSGPCAENGASADRSHFRSVLAIAPALLPLEPKSATSRVRRILAKMVAVSDQEVQHNRPGL